MEKEMNLVNHSLPVVSINYTQEYYTITST